MQNEISSEKGFLQVNVFENNVGAPLNNAKVTVLQTENGKTEEELFTDSSGNTEKIELDAPNAGYSLEEENDVKPYAEYNVKVEADGYIPTVIEGVQLISETGTFQNVFLKKQTEFGQQNGFIISPHSLWGDYPPKIGEEVIKPLPPSLDFVVLPEPVIPEYVIVHDGRPNDTSAPDYYVGFKDYIKNVACCEIYPTWPLETLEANILAIISFTLNRVYTEWYRGKGYNFTITSSTAYDQAFVYQRNIFDEISVVVDYLFTTYITKPGIRQPLFTQYCNGSTTSCPGWLEQWGSKYLGDQGYDAVQILRQYYGYDIYLMEAPKVEGVPVSFPGTPLQTGSIGSDVRTIQEQLNVISDNYPAIPKLRVDGIFGSNTRGAVETFQSIFNLSPTGIVDFATWYQISNIFTAVARLVS